MAIKLDIEIGDVILTGKFKNKRSVVKSIGTDELGQPTINGKSMLKFRIEKALPQDKKSKKTREMQQEQQKQPKRKEMKISKKQLQEMIRKEAKKQLKEEMVTFGQVPPVEVLEKYVNEEDPFYMRLVSSDEDVFYDAMEAANLYYDSTDNFDADDFAEMLQALVDYGSEEADMLANDMLAAATDHEIEWV